MLQLAVPVLNAPEKGEGILSLPRSKSDPSIPPETVEIMYFTSLMRAVPGRRISSQQKLRVSMFTFKSDWF